MKNYITLVALSLLLFSLARCGTLSTDLPATLKLLPNDPFKSTMAPSQEFNIDAKKDNVVEGKNGTVAVFPKGCFKNAKGEIVEGNVKIELTETLSLSDMLLSNLTTTSNGKPLVTGGMLYFNATSNGEQLTVNKDHPVHFEVPTKNKVPGMMAYKGVRDSNGNMNWTEPKELDKYLVAVDLNLLDFLPEHFEAGVEQGMPYKNHKTATPELVDSLYYLLSVMDGSELLKGFVSTKYNEAYYNNNKKVVNGKYTDDSYKVNAPDTGQTDSTSTRHANKPGIDPAMIRVIKSKKYQNTLIATREFEARLKVMFQTCNASVLEIYIQHLDKNLYELDSMAVQEIKQTEWPAGGEYHKDHVLQPFEDFASQRLTNVKDAGKYAALLKGYYDERLLQVRKDLETAKAQMTAVLDKKNAEAEKLTAAYKDLLWKREKYRMETYGFNWTETGWINIDNGTIPKTWGPQPLSITVDNGKQFDRVYTYIVYQSIKSLYRLNTTDNITFNGGNDADNSLLMPKSSSAILVGIGYKNEMPSISIKQIVTGSDAHYSMTLTATTMDGLKKAISPYEQNYLTENSISEDLYYMVKLFEEQNRQKSLMKEAAFISELWYFAYPCGKIPAADVKQEVTK